jgi:hypothetical protein
MHHIPEGSVLDRRTLNRALLARQRLLERVAMQVPQAVEHLVGMQAQNPGDPYVALWSRLRGFDPTELGQLMLDRGAVRMTLMRTTLHLVTARDGRVLRPVTQGAIERTWRSSGFAKHLAGLDLAPVLARGIELVEAQPRSTAELARRLVEQWPDRDPSSLAHAVRFLVPLVQVTPRGVWGSSMQPKVTTVAAWLGEPVATDATPDDAVRRYLRAFGPATTSDIRTWSWLTGVREIVDRLRPSLRSYRDEAGRELLDVADGLFADPDADAPVRFLPEFDNVFLSHADRTRITGDLRWGPAFAHLGTLFVDGFLAGAWKLTDGALSVRPMIPLSLAQRDEVEAEAGALLTFLDPRGDRRVEVQAGELIG